LHACKTSRGRPALDDALPDHPDLLLLNEARQQVLDDLELVTGKPPEGADLAVVHHEISRACVRLAVLYCPWARAIQAAVAANPAPTIRPYPGRRASPNCPKKRPAPAGWSGPRAFSRTASARL
jgi:hypothetical protein